MSTPTPSAGSPAASLQAMRVLALAVITAVPIFVVVGIVVLGLPEYPSPVVAGGFFVLNLAAFALAGAIGYRTAAIAPQTDPQTAQRQGLAAMQQTMTLRFAITEAPAILGLVWSFVEGSAWPVVISGFWALLSMAWHVWPSRRVAARLERSLDREGGRSGLTAAVAG